MVRPTAGSKLRIRVALVIECEEFVPAMLGLMVACDEDDRIQGSAELECLLLLSCFVVVVQASLPCLASAVFEFSRYLFFELIRFLVSSLALLASRSALSCSL